MLDLMGNRQKRARCKKLAAVLLVTAMLVQPWIAIDAVQAADAANAPIVLLQEQPVTSGAVLKKYEWKFDRNGKPVKVNANVIEVDLKNPYVKLDTIAGTNGQFTKKQTVREMAYETGAVAAINGDFYNTKAEGVPMGPQISGGKLLATPPYLPGWYSFALTKENKPIVDLFTFQGTIIAKDGATYPLGGINKTYYWFEDDGVHVPGQHSHIDGLFMYTNAWGQTDRSNDGVTVPTEVLVRNGVIVQIAHSGIIDMIAPPDGYILRASGKADEFVRQHLKVGDPIRADYQVLPQDPRKAYDTAHFKTMIGGHTILVDEGKPAAFSRDVAGVSGASAVSRTAIGYSRDERYVYLIATDRSDNSDGMTLAELQQFMVKVGVWKGLNLDGGGSTQMVARPLGEFVPKLVNELQYGERRVVNGVGVYSTAPKGQVKGIAVQGPTALFLQEKATYSIKAYDEYYNPVAADQMPAQWTSSQPIGKLEGNTFTALKPGVTKLTVTSGAASQSIDVEVVGREQLASLKIDASSSVLIPNAVYRLPVVATTKQGATRTVPPEAIEWEWIGFKGKMEGDRMFVESIDPGSKIGRIIARYDGFSTMLTMPVADQRMFQDFERSAYMITFQGYPAEVGGTVKLVSGYAGTPADNDVLVLQYDFTRGTGTKAAYAMFGESGVTVPGEPEQISVKVKGDGSFNWVRAEIEDSTGARKLVDLTQHMSWTDWKTLSADLKSYGVSYPIKLRRLYVANPENGQDERAPKGEIAFDDVSFIYKTEAPVRPKNTVKLTVDKKSMTVNGKAVTLDQAPVILKDNTLVPVRFVVEAMGGEISWVDAERKVIVLKDDHLIELWLDKPDLLIDGKVVTAEVPPVLMNERTMVPLRIIAEHMGWKVTWDNATRSITLE